MTNARRLRGIELRYVITDHIFRHGPQTVVELTEELRRLGFDVKERASKTISDALRWEVAHGRITRLRHGLYGPAERPRSTEHRIYRRAMALRDEADTSMGRDEQKFWDWLLRQP